MRSSKPLHRLQRITGQVPNFQRWVGKWPTVLLMAGMVAIPSCAPPSSVAVSEASTLPWRGNETEAYRRGHKDGSGAKRAGQTAASRPGEGPDYQLGYQDGYRHPHDNPWSRPRAYQLGYEQGRREKLAGRSEPPARNVSAVPQSVSDEYVRGYRAGRE